MDDHVHAQLTEAYQLIKAGDKATALEILRPICKSYPESVDAWWLTSYAVSDPAQVRAALQRVLLLDPFHEQAQQRLDKVITHTTGSLPAIRVTGTTKALKPTKQNKGGMVGLAVISFVLILVGVVGAVIILSGNKKQDTTTTSVEIVIPTAIILPSPTITSTFTPSLTPTITPTYTPAYTLPATWTAVPTQTIDPLFATNTPWIVGTTVLSTADPALFGETYWEGIGDGFTLDKYTRSGGRHLRFYDFPIKFYVEGANTKAWQNAIQNTLDQVNQAVPMVLVDTEADATLVMFIYDPSDYELWSGCSAVETLGCATIFDLGDFGGGDVYHRIIGQGFISTLAGNPKGTMLHETMHALGVMVHSPRKGDIMYPAETSQTYLSQRDLNTLRRLYANPSYNGE